MRLPWSGPLLAVVATVGLLGCNGQEACAQPRVPLKSAAGETYRCIASEDCPRSSQVSLCVTDVSPQQECIRCEDTVCVHIAPGPC